MIRKHKPLFLAFEGIDGCGKSTQVKHLSRRLEREGFRVHVTAEPTKRPVGKMIREIFSHRMKADHRVIAGLFVADRLDHLLNEEDGMLQKLGDGNVVICDRYYFSSYAYQGAHMPLDWVIQANSLSAGLLRPDLNIFLDISPEVSMDRIRRNRGSLELFETPENQDKVRKKYFEAFELLRDQEAIFITDGNRDAEEVAQSIWEKVSGMLG